MLLHFEYLVRSIVLQITKYMFSLSRNIQLNICTRGCPIYLLRTQFIFVSDTIHICIRIWQRLREKKCGLGIRIRNRKYPSASAPISLVFTGYQFIQI
jgi:hypothetical protein